MKITQDEYNLKVQELEKLKSEVLPKIKKDLNEAIEQGDGLHDNALWQMAQEKFNRTLTKINELEKLIREYKVFSP